MFTLKLVCNLKDYFLSPAVVTLGMINQFVKESLNKEGAISSLINRKSPEIRKCFKLGNFEKDVKVATK